MSARRSSRLGPSGRHCDDDRPASRGRRSGIRANGLLAHDRRNDFPGDRRALVVGMVLDRALAQCQQHRRGNPVAVRRGLLVLKALPEVVPGTSFRESILGNALVELSHLENLSQRVPILMAALLIAAAAIGLGDLVLRLLRLEPGISLSRARRPRLWPGSRAARRAHARCRKDGVAESLAGAQGSPHLPPRGSRRLGSGQRPEAKSTRRCGGKRFCSVRSCCC